MWTAADVRAEMLNIGKVLEARRQSVEHSALDEEQVKHETNMVNNCAQRIKVIANLFHRGQDVVRCHSRM